MCNGCCSNNSGGSIWVIPNVGQNCCGCCPRRMSISWEYTTEAIESHKKIDDLVEWINKPFMVQEGEDG